ncbi:MAG: hypothetical protein K2L12_05615 [Clostridia bacterium]|nr:hypothetical protein [Clostridia bacterium]
MRTAIIDIGSNSVRLAIVADGKTLSKQLATTRLGEGLSTYGVLNAEAIERTAQAVCTFKAQAECEGIKSIYAFATAAVRSAPNGGDFVRRVYDLCGIKVDVISGEQEAQIGLMGALKGADGGIIDVGGASTEVTIRNNGNIIFAKSVNIGTVRLYDLAGRDRTKLEKVIDSKLEEYGNVSASAYDMYTIGGTASRLASIKHGLKEYHPEITDGTRVTVEEMAGFADKLLTMPVEEIRATTICTNSADIVGGGCLLIYKLMKKLGLNVLTVSESDNLEGYYMLKAGTK